MFSIHFLKEKFLEDLKGNFNKYYTFVLSAGFEIQIPHPIYDIFLDSYKMTFVIDDNTFYLPIKTVIEELSLKPFFTIRYDDWVKVFKPIKTNDVIGEVKQFDEIPDDTNGNYIWTEISGENESYVTLSGAHYVNRIAHYLTEAEPPTGIEIEVDDMDYITTGQAKQYAIDFMDSIDIPEEKYEDPIHDFFNQL